MPDLTIKTTGFHGGFVSLNGIRSVHVPREKCIKFATTVGLSYLTPVFGRTTTGLAFAAYRAAAVRCAIDFGKAKLHRFPQFKNLERSEQASISYWIGMTFAAIATDDVLQVSKLIHAEKAHGVGKKNASSKSLADLVGQDDHNRWHVVEAKGRQRRPTAQNQADWKNQSRTITEINGQSVATNSYAVGLLQRSCSVQLHDPPPQKPNPVKLNIPPETFGIRYYEAFLEFVGATDSWAKLAGRSVRLRVVAYDPVDNDYVYVGLDKEIIDAAQRNGQFPSRLQEHQGDNLYIATDGIAVMTSKGPCDL